MKIKIKKIPNKYNNGGHTNMPEFSNGLIKINTGGSHSINPNEGVPVGVDPEGIPNLVEEGETIFNDYVFSNRLKVPKAIRSKYKLRGKKPITFAEASKQLSKESEERPNDPISKMGIEALMADLANTLEKIKANQNTNEFALGGNLFAGGGWEYNNTNNNTDMAGNELFSPFFHDNTFDFAAMHADDSAYRQKLDKVASILYKRKKDPNYKYTDDERKILEGYRNNVRAWNNNKGYEGGIDELSFDKIIGDSLTTTDGTTFTFNPKAKNKGLALDSKRGGHYWGATGVDPRKVVEEHKLMGKDGTLTDLPEEQRYWTGRRQSDSKNWDDLYGKTLKREDEGRYTTYYDDDNNEIRRYLYSPLDAVTEGTKNKKHYVRIKNNDGTYGDAILFDEAKLKGLLENYLAGATGKEGEDDLTYYDPIEKYNESKSAQWLRYAPALGFGLGTLSDSIGLTNKPDFYDADAILEATRSAGTYLPVRYRPIGNYLTYKPMDRDYYINQQHVASNAAMRNIMNTSAGNRGTAMAGILGALNNYLNNIGKLAREAEEYNFNRRKDVEDFNRTTNMTNSSGFLLADTANQSALASLRDYNLRGTMAAADLRQKAREASDKAKSANFSGLFLTLGDIGYEEKNRDMVDWGMRHNIWGPISDGYTWSNVRSTPITSPNTQTTGSAKKKSKGGKIRKRKGLTY